MSTVQEFLPQIIKEIQSYLIVNYKPKKASKKKNVVLERCDGAPRPPRLGSPKNSPRKRVLAQTDVLPKAIFKAPSVESRDIADHIEIEMEDTWQTTLFDMIDRKRLNELEVYKNAALTKQTFSKIRNDSDYHPDKDTAIRLCIGMKLTVDETVSLLAKAGYALSNAIERDLVIKYCLENDIYDIYDIDIILEEMNLKQFLKY